MHDGKGIGQCRHSPAVSKRPSTAPLALANERHHEYATLEHLLLSLTDDKDAAAVMKACNVDLDVLRRSLTNYIDTELSAR